MKSARIFVCIVVVVCACPSLTPSDQSPENVEEMLRSVSVQRKLGVAAMDTRYDI